MSTYRDDLIRAANETCTGQQKPGLAGWLSINEATGTVSDRRDGTVHAYVSPAWTLMPADEFNGRWPWPKKLGARNGRE